MKLCVIRLFSLALLLAAACLSHAAFAAQAPSGAPPPPAEAAQQKAPSAIMQPALASLQQALAAQRTDKWKMPAALRELTDSNINSIHHDLDTTLPPLLQTADAAPDSAAQMLPAYRNIEALYDVLLRVTETSSFAAPSQQSDALQQAISSLDEGRRSFADRLQSAALASDRQIHSLQATIKATPPPAPAPPPCPTPTRTTKKRTAKPKPAQPNPSNGTAPSP
jgi:hypothetical protein